MHTPMMMSLRTTWVQPFHSQSSSHCMHALEGVG